MNNRSLPYIFIKIRRDIDKNKYEQMKALNHRRE
jgi:hypothetical protein